MEPLLLTSTSVRTYSGQKWLTNASGFFFERDEQLFLVTSRHVFYDKASEHFPDRIEIEFHVDSDNVSSSTSLSILLYKAGQAVWKDALDATGEVDVAVVAIDRSVLPATVVYHAFTREHLYVKEDAVEVGDALLIVGYPLGFHDSLHHVPVVRQASIASSFGFRFQGNGYFLTDARTHRGTSGAAVVKRPPTIRASRRGLQWILLGIHSATFDLQTRDTQIDEGLALNSAWYADILLTLTS